MSAIIAGDERQLLQLVKNLLADARTYARSVVTFRVKTSGDDVVLEVCDDGPGVEAEMQTRLFGRFL